MASFLERELSESMIIKMIKHMAQIGVDLKAYSGFMIQRKMENGILRERGLILN